MEKAKPVIAEDEMEHFIDLGSGREKAKPVISEDEMEHFNDLGLGRGIDATSPFPWKNKRSFQVRHVKFDDVMGTEECGAYQNYTSTITSSTEIKTSLKASLSLIHTPVSFGLDNEMSRSSTKTRKVVGTRVVNRTVSFRKDGAEGYSLPVLSGGISSPEPEISSPEPETFEEFVSQWILNRIEKREKGAAAVDEEASQSKTNKSVVELSDYIQRSSKEEREMVQADCINFIRFFGITHYVSSITLGATEYQVLTTADFALLVSAGTNISATSLASAGGNVSSKSSNSKKNYLTHRIGKITDQKVARGSYDEAVIEISIKPILPLIRYNRLLQLAFHKGIEDYIEDSINDPTGPYVIKCGDKGIYWKIDEENILTITEDMNQASAFRIFSCQDTDDPHDFTIGWNGQTLKDLIDAEEKPIMNSDYGKITRYLEATSSYFGNNPGPLKMNSGFHFKNSQLFLYSQLRSGFFEHPADITPWIEKNGAFFISNRYKGFLCMSRVGESDDYRCRCVSSRSVHDEKDNWMLFQLYSISRHVRDSKRQHEKSVSYKDELVALIDK